VAATAHSQMGLQAAKILLSCCDLARRRLGRPAIVTERSPLSRRAGERFTGRAQSLHHFDPRRGR
jgi:hypothetical protein